MFMLARDESMPEHRSERTAKSAMKRVGRHGDFAIGTNSMHIALRRLVFLSASEAEAVIGKPPSLSNAVTRVRDASGKAVFPVPQQNTPSSDLIGVKRERRRRSDLLHSIIS